MIKREDVEPRDFAPPVQWEQTRNDFSFWLAPNNDPTDIGDQFSTLPNQMCLLVLALRS